MPNINTNSRIVWMLFSGGSLRQVVVLLVLLLVVSACSFDASLTELENLQGNIPVETTQDRRLPDFILGEVVTSSSGHKIRAVFGETVENSSATNSWKVRGVFYE